MLGVVVTSLILMSIIYSLLAGNTTEISNGALSGCGDAISLCLNLCGTMALWGGVMRVAEKCGITKTLSVIMRKPLRLLFRGLEDEKSLELIALNVTANLLGLGNAATPIGIRAMKRLCKTGQSPRSVAMFVLLNTASIQLVPITVSSMRLAHGAADPWDTTPATILTSAASVVVGAAAVCLLFSNKKGGRKAYEYARSADDCSDISHSGDKKGGHP